MWSISTVLMSPDDHPHGMDNISFEALFTRSAPVVFAYHGYPAVIHSMIHGRPNEARFHVRGFIDAGTTTTPFDMVVLNGMSRFDLAKLAYEVRAPPAIGDCRRDRPCSIASSTNTARTFARTSRTCRRSPIGPGLPISAIPRPRRRSRSASPAPRYSPIRDRPRAVASSLCRE